LRRKNKLLATRKWTALQPPLNQKKRCQRWSYQDTPVENNAIYGSSSSIQYFNDEDDIARPVYQDSRQEARKSIQESYSGLTDSASLEYTPGSGKSFGSSRRSLGEKQLSGYNFASMLLDDEIL